MNNLLSTLFSSTHNLNLFIHVGFACVALLLASVQLLNKKGGMQHRRVGRLFLKSFSIVILAAALGVFLFDFREFLAMLTLSAAYSCLAGYRVLVLRGAAPKTFDNAASIFSIICCVAFVIALEYSQYSYPKVTIYALIVSLVMMNAYDLSRNFLPAAWLQRNWLNEHIVKMLSAFSALTSAASGNLLPQYGAIAQLAPPALCLVLMISFITTRPKPAPMLTTSN